MGTAVRTEYDEEHLLGKGFIYFASVLGVHRYELGPDIVERAWQVDGLLFAALLHEFGHVFGIPHIGKNGDLMSEGFMEWILQKPIGALGFWASFEDDSSEPINYFEPRAVSFSCNLNLETSSFFKLDENDICLKLLKEQESGRSSFSIFAIDNRLRARHVASFVGPGYWTHSHEPVVFVYLNPKQVVFPPSSDPDYFNRQFGPDRIISELSGTLRLKFTNEPIPAMMQISPECIRLFGVNGTEVSVLLDACEASPQSKQSFSRGGGKAQKGKPLEEGERMRQRTVHWRR